MRQQPAPFALSLSIYSEYTQFVHAHVHVDPLSILYSGTCLHVQLYIMYTCSVHVDLDYCLLFRAELVPGCVHLCMRECVYCFNYVYTSTQCVCSVVIMVWLNLY